MRMTFTSLLLLAFIGSSSTASAQTAADVRATLKDGDKVSIIDDRGRKFGGRVVEVSAEVITITSRDERTDVPFAQIFTIDRKKDSVLNGALMGLGVGVALGFWQASSGDADYYQGDDPFCGYGFFDNCTDPEDSSTLTYVAGWGTLSALVGAAADALIYSRDRSVYRRSATTLSFTPVVNGGRKGAAVSLSW